MPPRKRRLSDQVKQLVASHLGKMVADSDRKPKERWIYSQKSDHWQETPRQNGRFASDRPTSKKVVNFKIPEDLMEELEQLAGDRNTSVNLVCKDFIVRNFTELVRQCQEENQA